jgi:tight adherence protein B
MNILIFGFVIFIALILIIEAGFIAYRNWKNPDRHKIRERLKAIDRNVQHIDVSSILRKRMLSEVPLFNRTLQGIPVIRKLDRLLQEANVQYPVGFFILLTLLLGAIGFLVAFYQTRSTTISLVAAFLLGSTPFCFISMKKKRRLDKFEKQLPQALALMARALRAGHAFTSAMKFTADEFEDPLGPEFGKALDEINFGVSVSDALKNIAKRLDSPDLKYFVVSVIIQREAGGNIAEVMDRIAYIIQERFKLRGKIKILSSEGKATAAVLVALPFLVIITLFFTSPEYVKTLWVESTGRTVCAISGMMMVTGVLIIRKMIRIKVQ